MSDISVQANRPNRYTTDLGVLQVTMELMNGKGLSRNEIAEKIGVKPNSVYQYTDRLKEIFKDRFEESTVRNGKYRLNIPHSDNLELMFLEEEEWTILESLLEDYPEWISDRKEGFDRLKKYLKSIIPQEYKLSYSDIFYRSSVGSDKADDDSEFYQHPDIFDDLMLAMKENRICEIDYETRKNVEKKYFLCPLLFFKKNGRLRLLLDLYSKTNECKKKYLTFIPWKIKTLKVLDQTFTRSSDDLKKIVDQSFGAFFGDDLHIKLWFSKEISHYIEERNWPDNTEITNLPDGNIEISMTASGQRELKEWILGQGKNARVIEPESFREEVLKGARELIEAYTNASIISTDDQIS